MDWANRPAPIAAHNRFDRGSKSRAVTAVGNLQKETEFNLQELVARELTFLGSYASAGEFRICIDLIASGQMNVAPLVSEVLPLAEGPRAFRRLLEGKENLLKIVLEP